MYKELQKLFPEVKLPVTSKKEIIHKHLELQLKNKQSFVQDFFNIYNSYNDHKTYNKDKMKTLDSIVDFIKETSLYKHFNVTKDFLEISKQSFNKVIHFMLNNNKENYKFIQIDVKEGNFNVLKIFNELFNENDIILDENSKKYLNTNTFSELFDEITKDSNVKKELLEVLKNSKSFRQVVYGNLNPKRNDKVLSFLIKKIENMLNVSFPIILRSQDELVFAVPVKEFNDFKNNLDNDLKDFPVRIKELDFEIIEEIKSLPKNDKKKFYIEHSIENNEIKKSVLKTVPKNLYIPLYRKHILKEEFKNEDFYVELEGNIFQMIILT